MDDKYNGWANRETWGLALHINNDEGLYDEFRRLAKLGESAVRDQAELYLNAVAYKDEFGSEWPDGLAMMAQDVGSLWRVDWSEIMRDLLDGNDEDDEDE